MATLVKSLGEDFVMVKGKTTLITEKAIRVLTEDSVEQVWLPKSHLEDWPDLDCSGEILMTKWIADQKGFEYR